MRAERGVVGLIVGWIVAVGMLGGLTGSVASAQRVTGRDLSHLERQSTPSDENASSEQVEQTPAEAASAEDAGPSEPVSRLPVERDAVVQQIVEQTNRLRRSENRNSVTVNATLTQVAQDFADFMARTDDYGHEADGRTPSQRAAAGGYDYCVVSENIQYQFRSDGFGTRQLGETMYQAWRDSPRHREAMVDPDVTQIGVAIAQSSKTEYYYGVQLFGRPREASFRVVLINDRAEPVRYRLGDEEATLQPRYVRTHTLCRPAELAVLTDTPSEDSAENGSDDQASDRDGSDQSQPDPARRLDDDATFRFVADADRPGGVRLEPASREGLPVPPERVRDSEQDAANTAPADSDSDSADSDSASEEPTPSEEPSPEAAPPPTRTEAK